MNGISQSGEKYTVHGARTHVDIIPTAVHTSGLPTKVLCHEKLKSAKWRKRWERVSVENMSTVCDIRCGPGGGAGAVSAESPSGKAGFQATCLFLSAETVSAWLTRGHTLSDRHRMG